jgi:hypothetical protein
VLRAQHAAPLLGETSNELAEGPEQEAGKSHGYRQRQDPGHHQVANRGPLQAGVICRHGAGDARR